MSVTDVSIASRALVLLGAGTISSFSEETDRAVIMANAYPGLKASLLSKYPWRFLMTKKALTRDAVAPINEWAYSYVIPGEAISGAPRAVFYSQNGTLGGGRYEIFGRRLYTNEQAVWVDIVENKVEAEWPAYFQTAVVYALCAETAFAITDQQSTADHWAGRAYGTPQEMGLGGAFGDAMAADAQGSANVGLANDAFVDARFGSWGMAHDFRWPD